MINWFIVCNFSRSPPAKITTSTIVRQQFDRSNPISLSTSCRPDRTTDRLSFISVSAFQSGLGPPCWTPARSFIIYNNYDCCRLSSSFMITASPSSTSSSRWTHHQVCNRFLPRYITIGRPASQCCVCGWEFRKSISPPSYCLPNTYKYVVSESHWSPSLLQLFSHY